MPRWIVSREDETRTEETLRRVPLGRRWSPEGALEVLGKGFYP